MGDKDPEDARSPGFCVPEKQGMRKEEGGRRKQDKSLEKPCAACETEPNSPISGYSGDVESVGEDSISSDGYASIDSVNCPTTPTHSPTAIVRHDDHNLIAAEDLDHTNVDYPLELVVSTNEQVQVNVLEPNISVQVKENVVEVENLRRKRTDADSICGKRKKI